MSGSTVALGLSARPWAMWKYLRIFRVSLVERLTYRADFLLGTVLRFLPLITSVLLWTAVYRGSGEESIEGYTCRQVIAYLLLVHISRMFSSMPGLAAGMARDIREGTIKRYLVQPLDLQAHLLAYRSAHKAAYIFTSALPYVVLFWWMGGYFDWPSDPWIWSAWIVALLLGFILGFVMEFCLGLIGFWFLEISSFLYLMNTISFFLSGHLMPLDLFGDGVASILKAMPFQFLAFYPASVLLGKESTHDLLWNLGVEACWCVAFFIAGRYFLRAGLKQFSAFGG
ncbi:MAG: ABC-2 family transporter protein [Planctomycetota bacterium]|nr:ABC-2 family transporter protein [Planctomycetota bacterium]